MRRRIHPRFWLIMIVLMFATFSVSYAMAQRSLLEGRQMLQDALSQRQELQAEVVELRTELDFAQTDDYIIRVARDELGLIMPGEIRYVSGD